MQPITTLLDRCSDTKKLLLPAPLRTAYGGDLNFPAHGLRSVHVFANFVATLDGIVSFQTAGKSGGGEISGFNAEDRFVMALLRSAADAVLLGSGTLHGDPGHVRTPEFICPSFREEFRSFRQNVLKKPVHPLNVVITGSGRIDLDEPTFHTPELPVVLITTAKGYDRLRSDHGRSLARVEVRTTGDQGAVSPAAAVHILHEQFGVERLLHEGGPNLFSRFLGDGLIHELFLTLAPQIAGRDERHRRLALAEGSPFSPDRAPWFDLVSLKASQSHLFLRYRIRGRCREPT
jgi:riboflavin biosynthesis pyrimidine reductase